MVGIRPNGGKAANDLIDHFTPGKFKPKDRAFSKEIDIDKHYKNREVDYKLVVTLPIDFCPDCNQRGKRGTIINIGCWDKDCPGLGLKKGEGIISFFCQECATKFNSPIKDPGAEVDEVRLDGIRTGRQRWVQERNKRIQENIESYIKWCRDTERWEIYCDGRKD